MNDDILKKAKSYAVDDEENSKVNPEVPNEYIEDKIGINVVKLLFEETFKETSKEILEKFPKPETNVEEVTFEKADV